MPIIQKELAAFFGRFFAQHMAAEHIPGAVIAVVKDGRIVFARGYGYANVVRRTPVSPDRTLFRICSVSKVITATAVMQLVEKGKLPLDGDVNRYLTLFKLPKTFPRPVTVANLLTHTGGFDELHIGRSTLSRAALRPLGSYLAQRMPARVVPPGEEYSYSDHGYALAGYLVETVSGVPFARYVEQHIFRPLGMLHSSFRQPLPPRLAANLATGYDVSGRAAHAAPFEYFNTAPAAAMSATATDMARFMIAQLQGGQDPAGRILKARNVREMQQQHFSSYPRLAGFPPLPGVAYGFGIYYQNGQRILNHSGALRGFTSLLMLLPGQNLGIFAAGNTAHDVYLGNLQREFIDRFFPSRSPPSRLPPWVDPRDRIDRFAGSYWSTEYSRRTIEKVRQLLNQVQVTANGDASLTAHFWNGSTVRLTRVAPLLFQTAGGTPSYWAFQQDAGGHITHMVPGGTEVYDKIQWYETTDFQVGIIGALILIFLSGALLYLAAPLVRRLRRPRRGQEAGPPCPMGVTTTGRWLAGLNGGLNLVFLVTFLLLMESAASTQDLHYSWIEYGVPPGVVALLCLPLITSALAVTLPVFAALAWRDPSFSIPARLHYALLTLGALAFIPFLLYWNLLGFHF